MDEEPEKKERLNFLWNNRYELFSGILMIIGVVLSYFYVHTGGTLVGLAFGICFYREIRGYFEQLRDLYNEKGLFKTLMLIGLAIYMLLAIPAYFIASIVGFGVVFLMQWSTRSK